MNLERMHHAGRQLKLALALPCCFASLVLMALLFLPAEASAACTTSNPNPNPNPASFAAVSDFNGDCKSDLLWRNTGTEQVYFWLMNGTTFTSSGSPGAPTSDWVIQAVGDFDGDGKSDVLWRNSTTGEVYIWLMNGTTFTSSGSLGTVSQDWSIAGVGDFNGDGKADILWQNSTTGQVYIWFMNGTTMNGGGSVNYVSSGWNIVGIGDFNGDGDADILWQNGATGQVYVWLMNGTAITSTGSPGSPAPEWGIQGVGDFDGNGKSDILWQDSITGQIYIWFMNGTTYSSTSTPGSASPPQSTVCCSGVGNGWSIQGVGDYDGSGRAGILWRQLTTGQVYIWLMNGSTIGSTGTPATPAAAWQLATLAPYGCSNQVLCNILSATNNVRANGSFGPGNPAPSATAGGPLNPLVWDPGAATVAQSWAAQCNFNHNPNRDGGESIYASCSTTAPVTVTGTDAVSSWSAEAAAYTYSTNSCNPAETSSGECGHYTQLVWRTTNAVGCAVQQCTTNTPCSGFPDWAFVVCDYTPAGNWSGVSPY